MKKQITKCRTFVFGLLFFYFTSYSQVTFSPDRNNNLSVLVKIDVSKKTKSELYECLSNSWFIMDINSKLNKKTTFIKGSYSYNYYVNNNILPAGEIKYKFDYTIENGILICLFYDFDHNKNDSTFNSVGILPFEINDVIKKSFNEKQYSEILNDIQLNVANTIRLVQKNCIN